MSELHLIEVKHPCTDGERRFDSLVGMDELKQSLVDELVLVFDSRRFNTWIKRHHPGGLDLAQTAFTKAPLVLLSGEVGCGKTALASCVATPVAHEIDARILTMETPSDIRGGGHVGEVSERITEVFSQAKAKAAALGRGLLIIDEADDLATRRSQMQAHHEDRAGVNVLVKQIDQIAKEKTPMAIIMITNRQNVLDPAVVRRAALRLHFARPDANAREAVLRYLLRGVKVSTTDIHALVSRTERSIPYTYSDLTDRIAKKALRQAWKSDSPFSVAVLKAAILDTEPSPLMELLGN